MKKSIVAIGGGKLFPGLCREPETLEIDRRIVELATISGKREIPEGGSPRVLFVPTASGDNDEYCHGVYITYHAYLGCEVKYLKLFKDNVSNARALIDWADIIYVGGGNTLRMMKMWRRHGIDWMMVEAYEAGTVMCGLSAGAICWFDGGISDSRKFSAKAKKTGKWEPMRVKGLGLVDGICCPHFNSEPWRAKAAERISKRTGEAVVWIAEGAALELSDGEVSVLSIGRYPEEKCSVGLYVGGKIRWLDY